MKIPKTIAKKLKNPFPALFFAKMGWDRWRKSERNFRPEFHSYSTRPRKFQKKYKKKKSKNPFPALFLAKMGWDRQRKREKNLDPNSVHTRPGQENYEKNRKKNQKIKKPISGIIFGQNGIRLAEKERKKFYSRILFLPNPS